MTAKRASGPGGMIMPMSPATAASPPGATSSSHPSARHAVSVIAAAAVRVMVRATDGSYPDCGPAAHSGPRRVGEDEDAPGQRRRERLSGVVAAQQIAQQEL